MPIEHLPPRVQPTARRVRAFLMTDSTALLLLAVVQAAVGLYYLPHVLGDPLRWERPVESIMPITAWAWVHLGVSLICATAAFTDRWRVDVIALAVATGLNISWAFGLLAGAAETGQSILWLVGTLIFSLTGAIMWAVWRGKRGDIPIMEDRGEL